VKWSAWILLAVLAAVSSCGTRYAYDPAEEFDGAIDQATREEMREVRGEFWCNGYGDYFAPDEFDEIWCTSGGGICQKYEDLVDEVLDDERYDGGEFWVKAMISGFVGVPIDWYYELDCTRVFYVTSVHWIRVVRPTGPMRYRDEE
jgi:hypothetical protein